MDQFYSLLSTIYKQLKFKLTIVVVGTCFVVVAF